MPEHTFVPRAQQDQHAYSVTRNSAALWSQQSQSMVLCEVPEPLRSFAVQENISLAKDGLLEMSKGAAEIRAQYEAAKAALAESNKTLEALRELDGMIEEQAMMQNAFWWLQVQAAEAEATQMDHTLQVRGIFCVRPFIDCDGNYAWTLCCKGSIGHRCERLAPVPRCRAA